MSSLLSNHPWAAVVWSQLWQVSVLIVAVALAARLVARNRPHLAHFLGLVVLLKCVTPPWLASPIGLFSTVEAWMAADTPDATDLPTPDVYFGTLADTADRPPLPIHGVTEVVPPAWSWTDWAIAALAAAWTVGMAVVVARAAWQWLRFVRLVGRPAAVDGRPHEAMLASLARRLRVRRRVRLRITSSRIGPAVVGWLLPVIVLPEVLVQGRAASELEPMLAHELIHLRRGDTWTGLLRMAAATLWWFHPLVAWAGRLVSREAERCCDEAVVAELGIRPADYARCLLAVLEQKHSLTPVPAFPGVRPVEVTSRRMERIMRLGQGSRRRSPWWCWVVMIVVAGAVLPGAAWVAGKEEPAPVDAGKYVAGGSRFHYVVYDAADVLNRMQTELGIDEAKAKETLIRAIASALGETGERLHTKHATWHEQELDMKHTTWDGQSLVAGQVERVHSVIRMTLDGIRRQGFKRWQDDVTEAKKQVRDEVMASFATPPADGLPPAAPHAIPVTPVPLPAAAASLKHHSRQVQLEIQWVALPPGVEQPFQADSTADVKDAKRPFQAGFAVVDHEKAKAIFDGLRKDRHAKVLCAPRMAMMSGNEGIVHVGARERFLTGFADGKPETREVDCGTKLCARPTLQGEDRVRLDLRLSMAEVLSVQSLHAKEPTTGDRVEVQVPEVSTREVSTGVEMRLGQAVLLRGPWQMDAAKKPQETILMVRATRPDEKTRQALIQGMLR